MWLYQKKKCNYNTEQAISQKSEFYKDLIHPFGMYAIQHDKTVDFSGTAGKNYRKTEGRKKRNKIK
jgi:hypothetical protein